jgi:hypothetical protein
LFRHRRQHRQVVTVAKSALIDVIRLNFANKDLTVLVNLTETFPFVTIETLLVCIDVMAVIQARSLWFKVGVLPGLPSSNYRVYLPFCVLDKLFALMMKTWVR